MVGSGVCLSRFDVHRMGEDVNERLPPGGLIRWTIRGIDGMLRRHYGVVCYSEHPDCLLRISPGVSDMTIELSDGIRVNKGDPVLDLHLWNERLASHLLTKQGLARGRALLRHFHVSLRLLSAWCRSASNQGSFVALRAEFGMVADIHEVKSILDGLGFDTLLKEQPALRIWRRAFWDNLFSMALMWTFNPGFARTRSLAHLARGRTWMSLEKLHARFST
jgi:hypothetical protein